MTTSNSHGVSNKIDLRNRNPPQLACAFDPLERFRGRSSDPNAAMIACKSMDNNFARADCSSETLLGVWGLGVDSGEFIVQRGGFSPDTGSSLSCLTQDSQVSRAASLLPVGSLTLCFLRFAVVLVPLVLYSPSCSLLSFLLLLAFPSCPLCSFVVALVSRSIVSPGCSYGHAHVQA